MADESSPAVQRAYFADAVATLFDDFNKVVYPDWRSLLARLSVEAAAREWRGPLVVDELPYLVTVSPELPGVLQHWLDHQALPAGLVIALAGSSQGMMHSLAMSADSPLYGRAAEAFALRPLAAGFIGDALTLESPRDMVKAYAVWGGTPRYWELAAQSGPVLEDAVDSQVLDPLGVLHQEPDRFLREEIPSASLLRPLLDAMGMGAHRLSEIAGRVGVPATSLSRGLKRLQDMDLVVRDVPFGSSEKSGKRALYRIADPFFRFWFRFVAPYRSMLADSTSVVRRRLLLRSLDAQVAEVWEDLCRAALPGLADTLVCPKFPAPLVWSRGQRYWRGNDPEIDVVAASADGACLLAGEAKWLTSCTEGQVEQTCRELLARPLPPAMLSHASQVLRVVFVPERPWELSPLDEDVRVVDAGQVLAALRR